MSYTRLDHAYDVHRELQVELEVCTSFGVVDEDRQEELSEKIRKIWEEIDQMNADGTGGLEYTWL